MAAISREFDPIAAIKGLAVRILLPLAALAVLGCCLK
jgi:hypothetical protein